MAVRNKYQPRSFVGVVFHCKGSVLRKTWHYILVSGLLGLLCYFYYEFDWVKDYEGNAILPATAHRLMTVPVTFLLVFRSQISYSRYWEGRGVVSMFVRHSRELIRQITSYMQGADTEGKWLRAEARRLLMVLFCIIIDQSTGHDMKFDYSCLHEEEKQQLQNEKEKELVPIVAAKLGAVLAKSNEQGRTADVDMMQMDRNIGGLVIAWASAMKIRTTPMPFPYVQMLNVLLVVFVYTVPIIIVHWFKWATPIVTMGVAMCFFGINAIGVEIEEPFGEDANDFDLMAVETLIFNETRIMASVRDAPDPNASRCSRTSRDSGSGGVRPRKRSLWKRWAPHDRPTT